MVLRDRPELTARTVQLARRDRLVWALLARLVLLVLRDRLAARLVLRVPARLVLRELLDPPVPLAQRV